jgi:hypothetical protein
MSERKNEFAVANISVGKLNAIDDLDQDPFVPEDFVVEEHCPGGQWEFNAAKIELFLTKEQTKGSVVGNDLRKELKDKEVLNANVLDYLLAHPELIPDAWKDKAVFFWGTIYRRSDGRLYVRCLGWGGDKWDWYDYWLDSRFGSRNPAAVASLT